VIPHTGGAAVVMARVLLPLVPALALVLLLVVLAAADQHGDGRDGMARTEPREGRLSAVGHEPADSEPPGMVRMRVRVLLPCFSRRGCGWRSCLWCYCCCYFGGGRGPRGRRGGRLAPAE
jgi:hypothetical protein